MTSDPIFVRAPIRTRKKHKTREQRLREKYRAEIVTPLVLLQLIEEGVIPMKGMSKMGHLLNERAKRAE